MSTENCHGSMILSFMKIIIGCVSCSMFLIWKSAKHIYSEKAAYHELTEGMRAWVLKKSDIKKAFLLTRSFFTL